MSTTTNITITTEEYLNQTDVVNIQDNTTIAPDITEHISLSWTTLSSFIIVPLLVVVGCFGNTFTVIVMRSERFQHSSTGVYLTALALSDMTFILTFPFAKSAAIQMFKRDLRAISVTGCRLYFFVFRGTKISSSWYVVLIGIERFLVVWFPLRAKVISNKRIALITVACVTAAIFTFESVRTGNTNVVNGICVPFYKTPATEKLQTAFVVASTTIYSIIPTAILLAATPLTVGRLIHQQTKRREMTQHTGSGETLHVTVMLLSVTIAYLVLVTLTSMAHAVAFFRGEMLFLSTDPTVIIFLEVAQILEQLNYAINFFLYVIANRTFRRHVFYILKCKWRRNKFQTTSNMRRDVLTTKRSSLSTAKEVSQSSSTQTTTETQSI